MVSEKHQKVQNRRRQVQCHARARAGHNGKPSFPMNSVPQRKRPRSYWNTPTSDLPRASLFEPESYFLLGPVGTLSSLENLDAVSGRNHFIRFVHGFVGSVVEC